MSVNRDKHITTGELAEYAGVSVRTLYHYDQIGLLPPARRTSSGYRLYGPDEVDRMLAICVLREFQLPLERIQAILADRGRDLDDILDQHLFALELEFSHLRRQMDSIRQLMALSQSRKTATTQELLVIMKQMNDITRHYSKDQLETLAERREELGEDGMRQVEKQWETLIGRVREARDQGKDSTSTEVAEMAAEWQGLIETFTGGDPGIHQSLQNIWDSEADVAGYNAGEMRDLMEFLAPAFAASTNESS